MLMCSHSHHISKVDTNSCTWSKITKYFHSFNFIEIKISSLIPTNHFKYTNCILINIFIKYTRLHCSRIEHRVVQSEFAKTKKTKCRNIKSPTNTVNNIWKKTKENDFWVLFRYFRAARKIEHCFTYRFIIVSIM